MLPFVQCSIYMNILSGLSFLAQVLWVRDGGPVLDSMCLKKEESNSTVTKALSARLLAAQVTA